MVGLMPETGGKLSTSLPMLESVTIFGLSVLVAPTLVLAKVMLGGVVTSTLTMFLDALLATKRLPLSSVVRPYGELSAVAMETGTPKELPFQGSLVIVL